MYILNRYDKTTMNTVHIYIYIYIHLLSYLWKVHWTVEKCCRYATLNSGSTNLTFQKFWGSGSGSGPTGCEEWNDGGVFFMSQPFSLFTRCPLQYYCKIFEILLCSFMHDCDVQADLEGCNVRGVHDGIDDCDDCGVRDGLDDCDVRWVHDSLKDAGLRCPWCLLGKRSSFGANEGPDAYCLFYISRIHNTTMERKEKTEPFICRRAFNWLIQ